MSNKHQGQVKSKKKVELPCRVYVNALACADGSYGTFVLTVMMKELQGGNVHQFEVPSPGCNHRIVVLLANQHSGRCKAVEVTLQIIADDLKKRREQEPSLSPILTCDGEFGQLTELTLNTSLRDTFKEANATVIKLAAGTSLLTQPLDRSRSFKDMHRTLEGFHSMTSKRHEDRDLCKDILTSLQKYINAFAYNIKVSRALPKVANALMKTIKAIPACFTTKSAQVGEEKERLHYNHQ